MDVEKIREHCILKKDVSEGFPFGESTLVFKLHDKIFILLALDANPPQFNAKCDPERAIQLRERYSSVMPGYHMNKLHWNTIICDGSIPESEILKLIDHSYDLIKQSLPKKFR